MSDKFNPQDHYYDKQGNLSKRPKKDPSVLFFGLPLVRAYVCLPDGLGGSMVQPEVH